MFSVHTTVGEFENGALTLNVQRIKCFPSILRWGNLKTELSL